MDNKLTVIMKLTNRDEIIAKAVEMDDQFQIFKPIQIFHVPDQATGQMKMGMTEYMPYAMDEMVVMKSSVVTVAIPQEQLANQYAELTGDIILPSTQIITG